jgi:outer membrane protein assembly factor BamB
MAKMRLKFRKVSKGAIFTVVLLITVAGIYWAIKSKGISSTEKIAGKESKQLELIWQKEFDGVGDVWILQGPRKGEKNEIPLLEVHVGDMYSLFGEKGEIFREIKYGRKVSISEDRKYLLETVWRPSSSGLDIRFTSWEGKVLWERTHVRYGTELSPTGEITVLTDFDSNVLNGIEFLDKNGKVIRKQDIEYVHDSDTTRSCFSKDGNYYAFVYRQGLEIKEMRGFLSLFNKNGHLLWTKEDNKLLWPRWLLLSTHGERIFLITGKSLYCLDRQGRLLWETDWMKEKELSGPIPRRVILSPKDDFLVILFDEFIFVVEASDGEEIWRLKLEEPRRKDVVAHRNLKISPDEKKLGLTTYEYQLPGKFYIIDSGNGDIIVQGEYPISDGLARLAFSADSKSFYIVYIKANSLFVYKLEI